MDGQMKCSEIRCCGSKKQNPPSLCKRGWFGHVSQGEHPGAEICRKTADLKQEKKQVGTETAHLRDKCTYRGHRFKSTHRPFREMQGGVVRVAAGGQKWG